jgi:hypothetical protein
MNNKKVIDLSPKILNGVSILSIILIICHIAMDIIFNDSIKYSNVVPLITLFIFCRYFRKSALK